MNHFKIFVICVFFLGFSYCHKNEPEDIFNETESENVSVKNGVVTINPVEYYMAIRNPMKGLREYFNPALDEKRGGYPYPYGTLIKEYMQWNKLENNQNDGIDKIIEYSNYRWKGVEDINMKVIPRVFLVWKEDWHNGPENNPDEPDDLRGTHWPSDIPEENYSSDPDTPITGGYFYPSFQDRVKKMVEKMGKAWDDDPRVAYIEMGIIGEWGEHHDPDITTYWPAHDQDYHVANRTWLPGIKETLGEAFTAAFKNKKVMVRYAYDFPEYEFGIYWDSFALPQEMERGYNEMLKLGDRWKIQPMGGELSWHRGDHAQFNSFEELVADPTTQERVIKHIRDLHVNHIGGITWANFADPEFIPNAAIIQKALGYRFLIKEFSYPTQININSPFSVSMEVVNTGSSPFYYNWPLELSLLNAETKEKIWSSVLDSVNISEWMPGENWDSEKKSYQIEAHTNKIDAEFTIDTEIPQGKYIISLAILDPAGMLPSLRFATANYFIGGRHPLGYVGVNEEINEFEIPYSDFDDLSTDKSLKYLMK